MDFKSSTPNIGVRNVAETVAFYTDILGFNPILQDLEDGVPVWAMVGLGSVIFTFQEEKNLQREYPLVRRNADDGYRMTFHLKINDVKELYDSIKDKVQIVEDLHATDYGTYEFTIADNNGLVMVFEEENEEQ